MDDLIEYYYHGLNPGAFCHCNLMTSGSASCLDCFRDQFFNGNEISYDCDEKRKLYLLRFLFTYAMENYHGMIKIPCGVIDKWFTSERVNILSIGGGPGSDILGVLSYLREESERRQIYLSVDVVRLDVESKWDEMFSDIMNRFFPQVMCNTVHLNVNDGFGSISSMRFDVVTASYLASELTTEECLNLADEVNSVLVNGGVLMINDRPEFAVEENIRSMFNRIGLRCAHYYLTDWANYSYSSDIAAAVRPKFSMNSSMFVGMK